MTTPPGPRAVDPVPDAVTADEASAAPGRDDRGFALVMVLVVCLLLSLVAAALNSEARASLKLARAASSSLQAEALADAGVHRAMARLFDPRPDARWAADGGMHRFALDGGEVRVQITDEAGKIDLNGAGLELIAGLLRAVAVPPDAAASLAGAIVDFRDEDDAGSVGGDEIRAYREAGLAYGPKNRPFEIVEELRLVPGISDGLFRRLRPHLTVYTHQRGIDPAVADPIVLSAIPQLEPGTAEAILAARSRGAEAGRTAAAARLPAPYLARSQHRVFAIIAEGVTESGATYRRYAVVRSSRQQERPFSIHWWATLYDD